MRALRFETFGSPEVLHVEERPAPDAVNGDAVVRVQAAAVNPSDVKNVAGAMEGTVLPRTPGRDFAGVVVGGPGDVVGRAVWGTGGALGFTRDGTHAELVAFPAEALRPRPSSLSSEEAAAVPVTFLTAWAGLVDGTDVRAGESVVVFGASGGVGSAVTQLAHWRGARVTGVDIQAPPENTPRAAVPDLMIIASGAAIVEQVRAATGGRGADAGFDAVGGADFEVHLQSLAAGGRMAVIASVGERRVSLDLIDFYRRTLRLVGVDSRKLDAERSARILERLAPGFDSGALAAPVIGGRYPLDRAREAYEAVGAGRARGRVVLVP